MTTVDSTATLPPVRTAPPVNGKDLTLETTGIPAPRYDGKNLLITLDVGSDNAVLHCQDPEHVGTHKQRHVLFCANEHCWLIFDNKLVFPDGYLELEKDENSPAHVSDDTRKAETRIVDVIVARTAKAAKIVKTAPDAKHGPVIVVP